MTAHPVHTSTAARNTCRVCEPLGASLAYLGLRKCLPLIHGSQGCSTYIRRYMIGHYREPVDIASTNFTEESAVFGGGKNFVQGIANMVRQYHPEIIGASTSCLAETMGEDMSMLVREAKQYLRSQSEFQGLTIPEIVFVRTASYRGSHRDGYFATLLSMVQQLAEAPSTTKTNRINLFAPFCSPADIRHLKGIGESYHILLDLIPDYSQSLDDGQWASWQVLPEGGTTLETLKQVSQARASIEFQIPDGVTAGSWLKANGGVEHYTLPLPLGIQACDQFFDLLGELSGCEMPAHIRGDRERLLDAYVDAHKFVYGKKALVYGDEESVCAVAAFLCEIGIEPVLCATGGKTETLKQGLERDEATRLLPFMGFADFEDLKQVALDSHVDLMIGNSKGYVLSRELGIPLVRMGFPIHDRVGGQRMLTLGYQGTQNLFDQVVNAIIEQEQNQNPYGYKTY